MALGFRFTAERLYEVGFLNRLVDADNLMPTAIQMAEHMLTLPPAARVNTVYSLPYTFWLSAGSQSRCGFRSLVNPTSDGYYPVEVRHLPF
jgi:enoyl-CoA hydratase/carnithine racemase